MPRGMHRGLVEWSLVTVVVLALGVLATATDWLWRMDLQIHDAASSQPVAAADAGIVIVAIDDPSLAALGRWPWAREIHARLIERLREAGVAAIALDLILAEPASGDEALAGAMRRQGHVVLPVLQNEVHHRIVGETLPVPALMRGAAGLGHIQVDLDPDGLARSVYLWEGWGEAHFPQLALALLMAGERQPAAAIPTGAPAEQVWVRSQWLRIPFVGPPGSFRHLSYVDVLDGRFDDSALRGKLVLVGATAPGLADTLPVPTAGLGRLMSGVEFHANVLHALRHGGGIRQLPPWAGSALSSLILLGLMVVLGRSSPRLGLAATGGVIVGTLAFSWLGLRYGRFWFPPSSALLGSVLAYPLWSWRRLEAAQRYLDQELDALRQEAQIETISAVDPLQCRLVTLRLATERSREARRFAEDAIEHLPVGVIALNPDGRVRLNNPAARRLLGAADASAVAERLRQLHWPATLPLAAGIPLPPASPLRIELSTPQGTPLQVTLSALGSAGLLVSVGDLSEVRAAQQAREDTLRYVSHDLRAPLSSIISLIDAQLGDQSTLPQLRRLARSALDLVDELFRLGLAEAADPARFEPLDLVLLLYEAADACWEQARVAGTRVEVDTGGHDHAPARGSHELLRRAVVNLLSNAIKYAGDCGPVLLRLHRAQANWEVNVRDRGPGVPEEERSRLFERFSRLPSAVRRGLPGIGLGLAMVRTVAERHSGSVRAEFPREGGARFVLSIPIAAEPGAEA